MGLVSVQVVQVQQHRHRYAEDKQVTGAVNINTLLADLMCRHDSPKHVQGLHL